MLPTDLALIQDDAFRPHVDAYAADKDLFYADFAKASLPHPPFFHAREIRERLWLTHWVACRRLSPS